MKGGEILTEAGLSEELLLEKDNEVLNLLQGINDLAIVVPKKGSTKARTSKALLANSFLTLEEVPRPSASKPLPVPLIAKSKAQATLTNSKGKAPASPTPNLL